MMKPLLLTINIPTYNRATYLKRSLNQLILQKADFKNQIEIGVFDNCSTDNTAEIVKQAQEEGLVINYIKNESNIGPDRNIGQAYYTATSKYVLVLGDDDILLEGSISYLLNILNSSDYGLVYLNFYQFKKDYLIEKPKQDNQNIYLYNGIEILKYILSNSCFISANIVNTNYISKTDMSDTAGSGLTQLPGIFNAAKAKHNVFINKFLLAQQAENSGGYSYFKVFVENFFSVTNRYLKEEKKSRDLIHGHLLKEMFPYHLYMLRIKGGDDVEKIYLYLKKYYSDYFFFWALIYPLLKLPKTLAYIPYTLIRLYKKVYFKVASIHHGVKMKNNINSENINT